MKIAILGAGNIGGTLARRWAAKGHDILLVDPNDAQVQKILSAAGSRVHRTSAAEAVAAADVVLLAVQWVLAEQVVRELAPLLAGKILIDPVNPVAPGFDGLKKGLQLGYTTSAAEQIASWAPAARIVKCFNCAGTVNVENPLYGSQKTTMFYCGDDAPAKTIVADLARELDFDPIDAGPLTSARLLEPFGMLAIQVVLQGVTMQSAFKLLTR